MTTFRLSKVRAALLAGLIAVMCYVGALRNSWAMDDQSIVADNPAAHSIDESLNRFFEPYWPEESGIPAGQYRPLAIVWYAVDWVVSNGNPVWFHAVNVLMHGLATALFVLVVGKWLPPLGALVSGIVFAVHPVHVEAVANVVGRSEVATAVALLGAILCARRYRVTSGWRRSLWQGCVLSLLLAALFIKENAVVLIALLVLDEVSERSPRRIVQNVNLYLSVFAVTLAWLYLWQGVAAEFVSSSENPALRDTGHFERLSTMFPTYLHVLRLLVWPMDLSPDYNPQMILRRTDWSLFATVGLVQVTALLLLAWLVRKKNIAISVAIFASLISYAPTSNLLFASGVVLAERNLYVAVWAPAVVAGWVACCSAAKYRRAALAGLGVVTFAFLLRTVQRVPDWRSTEQVLTDAFAENTENFRGHLRIGSLLFTAQNYSGALAQALVAGEIFPDDPFVTLVTTPLAFDLGYEDLAMREAERGFAMGADYPQIARLVARARLRSGQVQSAVDGARQGVDHNPSSPMPAETYIEVLTSGGAASWRLRFATARDDWIHGRLGEATQNLREGLKQLEAESVSLAECWDIVRTVPIIEALAPGLADGVRAHIGSDGGCNTD